MTAVESMTEQSRAVVQGLYAAAVAGDVEGMLTHMADDVVIHEPEFLPYGGVYSGKPAFLELLGKIGRVYGPTITIDHLVADGDRVIGLIRMPDLNTGENVLLAEQSIVRDGKVVDMRIFFHDTQSLITAPKL